MTTPGPILPMRILVVEDNPKVALMIQDGLIGEKYRVDTVPDGKEGLRMAQSGYYNLLIVDVMLPGLSGLELTSAYRKWGGKTPILMLTAKTATEDKVAGLDSGADDYLTKPFAFAELLARMRSLFRRGVLDKSTLLTFGDLELDTVTHKAKRAGTPIDLTAKEYALLEFFMKNTGIPLRMSWPAIASRSCDLPERVGPTICMWLSRSDGASKTGLPPHANPRNVSFRYRPCSRTLRRIRSAPHISPGKFQPSRRFSSSVFHKLM